MTQNWSTTLALLVWPVFALWMYHTQPVRKATLWTILGAQLLLPVFLARQFLRDGSDHAEILHVLVIAGLLYSLPMLFEIRMSPQLHRWFYGYTPGDLDVDLRGGGFRPRVFMENGLSVALFTA